MRREAGGGRLEWGVGSGAGFARAGDLGQSPPSLGMTAQGTSKGTSWVLTIGDVMGICQVSRDTVDKWRLEGDGRGRRLRFVRIGRVIRIRAEWLEEFLAGAETFPDVCCASRQGGACDVPSEPSRAARIAAELGIAGKNTD